MTQVTSQARILVVEDDELLRSLFMRILSKKGYKIFGATSGNEALRLIVEETIPPIDIIFSDMRMPDGDGMVLLTQLKSRMLMPKYFVFITGHADLDKVESQSFGAHDILRKPVDISILIEYTAKLVAGLNSSDSRHSSL